jgi:hypothetical protein
MTDAQAGEGSSMDRMLGFTVIVILYAVIGLMAAAGAIFIVSLEKLLFSNGIRTKMSASTESYTWTTTKLENFRTAR